MMNANSKDLITSIKSYLYWENDLNKTIEQLSFMNGIDITNMSNDMLVEYNRCNNRIDLVLKKLDNMANFNAEAYKMSVGEFISQVNTYTESKIN